MQQVVGTKIAPLPRETTHTAETVVAKKKVDPWMLAVPVIVVTAWAIIFTWIAAILFLVRGAQWMGEAWKW